jgi:hypothetical protein
MSSQSSSVAGPIIGRIYASPTAGSFTYSRMVPGSLSFQFDTITGVMQMDR